MRLLDRYVFMEALAPFAFGMAAFNGILFASDPLRKAIVVFVENHVPVQEAVLLLLYRVPIIMAMTFPMAMLLGTLLGVGRLSSDNEAAAMFAGGASVHRLLVPVWVLGLLISAVAFGFNERLVPQALAAQDALLLRIGQRAAEKPQQTIVMRHPKEGALEQLIVAQRYQDETQTLFRPDVYFYRSGKVYMIVSAERAVWRQQRSWRFEDGFIQTVGEKGHTISSGFTEAVQNLGKSPEQVKEDQRRAAPQQMRLAELRTYIGYLQRRATAGIELATAQVELNNRYAVPLSSFLFALIGAPLALRPQRTTTAIAFGTSVVIIFVYYLIWYNASWLGNNGRLSPVLASWLSNAIMGRRRSHLTVRRAR